MLDFYNATAKHPALVFDDQAPKKILFKGSAKECMKYILAREPENPAKRDYIRNYGED